MEIHLETNELLDIIVDGVCAFEVNGYRNEEGTMMLEVENKK